MKKMRALSIRQPYAEQILIGEKIIEYRSRSTNIRGRVYIYASKTPGDPEAFKKMKINPSILPAGLLVGTVEITDCTEKDGYFQWHLAKPERMPHAMKPKNRAQPVWFYPF